MRDEIGGVQVGSLSNNPLFSEARYLKQGSGMFKIALIPTFATEGIFDNLLGVFSLQGEHMKDNRSFNTPVSIDDGYYSMWLPEPTTRWFVWGVVLPYSFLMLYRQRLEALKAEFRAKGLRV